MRRRRKVDEEAIMMELEGEGNFPLIETKIKMKNGERITNARIATCILIVVVVSGAFSLAVLTINKFPLALTLQDLMEDSREELNRNFIEERAMNDLRDLSSSSSIHQNPGTRLTGDVITSLKLIQKLDKIKHERILLANEMNEKDSSFAFDFDYEIKKVSGNLSSEIKRASSQTIIYRQLTSLMVFMEPLDPTTRTNTSVLIHCHFDSNKNSKLDLASCAVMLEVIRIMSLEKINPPSDSNRTILRNSFVFIFNGAGSAEKGALGLPSFFSDQNGSDKIPEREFQWLNGVKAFINLDWVDGGNGKAFIFKATNRSDWLLDIYAQSKSSASPPASIFAEMFFGPLFSVRLQNMTNAPDLKNETIYDSWLGELNNIPLQGLHLVLTSALNSEQVQPGSLSHMGNGLLTLLENLQFESLALANSLDLLFDSGDSNSRIYYDLFGLVQINYSPPIYTFLIILVLFVVCWVEAGSVLKFFYCLLLNCVPFGCLSLLIWFSGLSVGLWFNFIGAYKPWLFQPLLALFFYGIPAFITMLFFSSLFRRDKQDTNSQLPFSVFRQWIQSKFALLSILLLIWYQLPSLSAAKMVLPIFISLVFTTITCVLHQLYRFALSSKIQTNEKKKNQENQENQAVHLQLIDELTTLIIGEFLPLFHNMYLGLVFLSIFVPWTATTSGRLEILPIFVFPNNVEILGSVIGGFSLLLFHGLVDFFMPFIVKIKKTKTVLFLFWLVMVFVVNTAVLWGFGGFDSDNIDGVPYTEKTPLKVEMRTFDRIFLDWEHSTWTLKKMEHNVLMTSIDRGAMRRLENMEFLKSLESENNLKFRSVVFEENEENTYPRIAYNLSPARESTPESSKLDFDVNFENKQFKNQPLVKMNIVRDESVQIATQESTEFGRILTLEFEGQFESKTDILIRLGRNWTLENWFFDSDLINLDNSTTSKNRNSDFTDYVLKVYSGSEVKEEPFSTTLLLHPKSTRENIDQYFYYDEYKPADDFTIDVFLIVEFPFVHFEKNNNNNQQLEFQNELDTFLEKFPEWMSIDVKSSVATKYRIF